MSSLADKLRSYTSLDTPKDESITDMVVQGVAGFIPGVGQAMAARDLERARRDADPVAGALAASSFLPWGRLAGSARKIIAGEVGALKRPDVAKRLSAANDSVANLTPDELWKQHRVEVGLENHSPLKWEINDQPAKLTARALRGNLTGRLPDLIDHPELFKTYPHLNNVNVEGGFGPGFKYGGSYIHQQPGAKYNGLPLNPVIEAGAGDAKTIRDVLLHEIQHAVQRHEGFDSGANPDYIAEALRRLPGADAVSDSAIIKRANDKYLKNLGEQEARAVATASKWSDEARGAMRPSRRHDWPDDFVLQENLPGY